VALSDLRGWWRIGVCRFCSFVGRISAAPSDVNSFSASSGNRNTASESGDCSVGWRPVALSDLRGWWWIGVCRFCSFAGRISAAPSDVDSFSASSGSRNSASESGDFFVGWRPVALSDLRDWWWIGVYRFCSFVGRISAAPSDVDSFCASSGNRSSAFESGDFFVGWRPVALSDLRGWWCNGVYRFCSFVGRISAAPSDVSGSREFG